MTDKPNWADEIVAGLPREQTSAASGFSSRIVEGAIAPAFRRAAREAAVRSLRLAADKCLDITTEDPYQLSLVLRAAADEAEKSNL